MHSKWTMPKKFSTWYSRAGHQPIEHPSDIRVT